MASHEGQTTNVSNAERCCNQGKYPCLRLELSEDLFEYPERSVRRAAIFRAIRPHCFFFLLLFTAGIPRLFAQSLLDEDTERLLVDAVQAASALDFYNARCRSDVSGRPIDNLNKKLVSKFRMTVLAVEDDLFPERSYRRAKERLQRDFLSKLKEAGGCKEAKAAGMPRQLREHYDDLMREIDRLP